MRCCEVVEKLLRNSAKGRGILFLREGFTGNANLLMREEWSGYAASLFVLVLVFSRTA